MTADPVLAALAAVCAVLAEENAALSVMDIPRAVRLVEAKQKAADELARLPLSPDLTRSAPVMAEAARLKSLAAENKGLLERAMEAQRRVMACIARAMPAAVAGHGAYEAGGAAGRPRQMPAVALSSRA